MVDSMVRDLRHALRGLLAKPAYAVVSILTLSLVVGAATAVIAVISATMIRPLPFPSEDRLVQLFMMPPGTTSVDQRNPLGYRHFDRFRSWLQQAERVEGFWARERAFGTGAEPESVTTAGVSAGALELFGGVPMLGRMFSDEEARSNARVAVL